MIKQEERERWCPSSVPSVFYRSLAIDPHEESRQTERRTSLVRLSNQLVQWIAFDRDRSLFIKGNGTLFIIGRIFLWEKRNVNSYHRCAACLRFQLILYSIIMLVPPNVDVEHLDTAGHTNTCRMIVIFPLLFRLNVVALCASLSLSFSFSSLRSSALPLLVFHPSQSEKEERENILQTNLF